MQPQKILFVDHITCSQSPYPHLIANECLNPSLAEALLEWFEKEAAWKLNKVNRFYEVHDLDLTATPFPEHLSVMRQPRLYNVVRRILERQMCVRLSRSVHVMVQKMTQGQYIKTHTDWSEGGPAHRFVVQLNRGWKRSQGGLLVMLPKLNAHASSRGSQTYVPVHCSGIGFEISERSYHAVTPVKSGERYSMVFSYNLRNKSPVPRRLGRSSRKTHL